MSLEKTFVIIGGGAAGIFAAVNAARMYPDLKVIVLERSSRFLSKVRISGGGRCNLTHDCKYISEMVKNYPRGSALVKKTFKHFFVQDTIQWFHSRGMSVKAEQDGRMFPDSDDSSSVIEVLMKEADKYGVTLIENSHVTGITPQGEQYAIETEFKRYIADYILIATGGNNQSSVLNLLNGLKHRISPPIPSLFTFNLKEKNITSLQGVSVPNAKVKIIGSDLEQTGIVLITHWGLSGPAILRLSAFAAKYLAEVNYEYEIQISWNGDFNETGILRSIHEWRDQNTKIVSRSKQNPLGLPFRLWEYLMQESDIQSEQTWNSLSARQQNLMAKVLTSYRIKCSGKTTYKEEFVTAGGVSIEEVELPSCESKIHPRIFFAGEVLDVDGCTGGFNFQHAWSSGYCVAMGLKKYQ